MTGAEVVDRGVDSHLPELAERGDRLLLVGGDGRFGHFDPEQRGRQIIGGQAITDERYEIVEGELARSDIEADWRQGGGQFMPGVEIGEHGIESRSEEAVGQTDFLNDWDELAGRDLAPGWMVPTNQRLQHGDPGGAQIEPGLVNDREFVA